jgi:hypothetical protein
MKIDATLKPLKIWPDRKAISMSALALIPSSRRKPGSMDTTHSKG